MRSLASRRSRRHVGTSLLLTAAIGGLLSCSESTAPDPSGTYYGSVTQMGGGTGRSFVTLDRSGTHTEVGVAFTEAALSGLGDEPDEFFFDLPIRTLGTPFRHVVLNWEPHGHPPAGVYTVPHLDVHFYMITQDVRAAIDLDDPVIAAKAAVKPTAEYFPAGYVAGMASSWMGLHWRDPSGPEFSGQPFTKTVIYGSYDGAVTFLEPMLAKSFLETKPSNVVTALKLPATFGSRGYQPTSYTVDWNASTKEYRVVLTDLVLR